MTTETGQQIVSAVIPWGWIFGGLSIGSIIAALVWIGSQLVKFGVRLKTLEIVEKKINEVITDIKDLRNCHYENKNDITGLKQHTKYGYAGSPMQLSEEGKRLLEDCGFNAIYPKLKPKVFALMDAWNTRTLFDSEANAIRAMGELKNDALMDPMKEYAVNHPDEPLDLLFLVASWIIRDDYWNDRKKLHLIN